MILISTMLRLLVAYPISVFLWYTILKAIHPDRLVWFLFWAYVPIGILVVISEVVIEQSRKKAAFVELKAEFQRDRLR